MNFLKVVSVARKVLGKLTDILIAGRKEGLWSEKNSPLDTISKEKGFELKKEKH